MLTVQYKAVYKSGPHRSPLLSIEGVLIAITSAMFIAIGIIVLVLYKLDT